MRNPAKVWWESLAVGSKSLLVGAHQFILHPIYVAKSWIKLYGIPRDLRIWTAFVVHDWGYWGCYNMDGVEGEQHPELGAGIMSRLFDRPHWQRECYSCQGSGKSLSTHPSVRILMDGVPDTQLQLERVNCPQCKPWYYFTACHSRYYAKLLDGTPSRLCVADKLATPGGMPMNLYIAMTKMSGEIYEYQANALAKVNTSTSLSDEEKKLILENTLEGWYKAVSSNLNRWALSQKDLAERRPYEWQAHLIHNQ